MVLTVGPSLTLLSAQLRRLGAHAEHRIGVFAWAFGLVFIWVACSGVDAVLLRFF